MIAASNRPDIIDTALLRPGRFDRSVYIPLPDLKAREAIFRVHTKRMPLEEGIDFPALAQKSEGYTGADIEAVCREAALSAVRESLKPKKVGMQHFEAALKAVPISMSTQELMRYDDMKKTLGHMVM